MLGEALDGLVKRAKIDKLALVAQSELTALTVQGSDLFVEHCFCPSHLTD